MGSACDHDAPTPLLEDLKVTIENCSMIFPSKEIQRKSMFVSNIDKVLTFDVETVHFFGAHRDFPPHLVSERLKNALEDALVVYEFLGGRLKVCHESKRLEIDCSSEGAGFVVASSEYKLDQIGDLDYPNTAFAQLVHKNKSFLREDDDPLCVVQVTSFKCGGFAIGISTSHTTFDGLSFKSFLENIAALAANKPLAVTPCNDRHLLAARSPPRVTFPHPEMLKLNDLPNSNIFEASTEELRFKVFKLTSNDIAKLKEEARDSVGGDTTTRITGFNAITAHIWRCKALSCDGDSNPNKVSTILYAVDIRSRLEPPLPKSYTGNAVLTAYATATCRELEEWPFMRLVERVVEGATRMSNEYARSIIDWGEINKGFPNGEVLVSSWWRLGFEEVEYPWGKPKYCCPLVYHRKDIILLFPPVDGGGDGVSVIVALPPKEMDKFYGLFNKFLGV
ncbi:hypothetical protein PHAVU_004G062600 [Phaseolus vulgaris]|uniref:Omega-hydroxypalmitate O-feruloyl transferase n=1 Tax=Phaseolus vulgaris TaxID=3885 RepID=V7C3Y7_PHAVU|nr:hypothetical protein PHAVU_004G062600g [Phaseolus vulgaris]ESW23616.1 hypothetical protein PHAVU_004G062600g [Phaseolus vulgaris]